MNLAGRTKTIAVIAIGVMLILSFGCSKQPAPKPKVSTPATSNPHTDASREFTQEEQTDVGPPTYIAEGVTPAQHVEKYYQTYKEQNWEEAYALQPASSKARETLEAYIQSHQTMPLNGFTVGKPSEETDGVVTIEATLELGGDGGGMNWATLWTFKKDGKKWIAEKTQSGIKP